MTFWFSMWGAAIASVFLFMLVRYGARAGMHWMNARAADAEIVAPLQVGAAMIAGVVELDGAPFGARIEIEQHGTEWITPTEYGPVTRHRWTESERRTFSRPFWILHHSGARVWVDQASDVHFVAPLEGTLHHEETRRFRFTELRSGDLVVARGMLAQVQSVAPGQGYRDATALQWVFQPGDVGGLQLSVDTTDRLRKQARLIMRWLLFGWLVLGLIDAALIASQSWGAAIVAAAFAGIMVMSSERATKRDWIDGQFDEEGASSLPEPEPSHEPIYSLNEP